METLTAQAHDLMDKMNNVVEEHGSTTNSTFASLVKVVLGRLRCLRLLMSNDRDALNAYISEVNQNTIDQKNSLELEMPCAGCKDFILFKEVQESIKGVAGCDTQEYLNEFMLHIGAKKTLVFRATLLDCQDT